MLKLHKHNFNCIRALHVQVQCTFVQYTVVTKSCRTHGCNGVVCMIMQWGPRG